MTVTFDVFAAARLVVGLVCLALLTSIGGAGIFASPVTLPLLWAAGMTARSVTGRVLLNVVAVLTAGEAFWAVGYALGTPYEWMLPLLGMVAVGVLFPWTQRHARPASTRRTGHDPQAHPEEGVPR